MKEGESEMRLKDKVAIITGAAQGIGAAIAEGYGREGAKVVIADIIDGQEAVAAAEKAGGEAIYAKVDVTSQEGCDAMAEAAIKRFGRIDILVNNAAMFGNLIKKPFMEITTEEWNKVMEVNTTGPFHCTKSVFPYMKDGGGRIINVGSSVLFEAPLGFPHYVASKGAVFSFTRAMARELGAFNINVNSLAPGYTQSEGSKKVEKARTTKGPSSEEIVMQKRCLKKTGLPEYLVGTAIFLASGDSEFITGQLVLCDGGASFH
jgi:NAD(P)-dependent dehydrogenase (short-subunit alcohol dehydrogenase family)